jgi:hypothetical protein
MIELPATFTRLPVDLCHSFKMLTLVEKESHCSGQKKCDALSARPLDDCRSPVVFGLVALRRGGVGQSLTVFLKMPREECR